VPSYRSPARRARLAVQPLERRVVPAAITATFTPTTGLLTLAGTDDAEDVTIHLTGAGATFTSTNGTTLPAPVVGLVKSIKADFKGGDDTVAIDNLLDFSVSGPVAFTLGDGNNSLSLDTSGKIALGGLTVTGGDGADTLTVRGGVGKGSTVGGNAKFTFNNGGSTTTLEQVAFNVGGVTLTAGDAITTPNTVGAINVTVLKTFAANMGNSFPAEVDFQDSTLGGLKVTGYSVSSLMKGATLVTGGITFKTLYNCDLQADGITVNGSVALTAPNANFEADATGVTIGGNLSLTGSAWTNLEFLSATPSRVKGNITVKGGWYNDVFTSNALFTADKNISLTLNGGDNSVSLGDGTAAATVGGTVTVKTGAGNDTISIDRVTVTGAVSIATLGGADILSVEDGATFVKTFAADLGAGDDFISIAQNTGASNPVTFTGQAKILGGLGNDLLLLGLAQPPANTGDANSKARFLTPGSQVDGGLGLNSMDPDSQYDPANVAVAHWA